MPVVRSVTPGEVDRAGEIGAIAFEGTLEEWQKAFNEFVGYFGTESMLVVEHEGQLVSSMLMVPEGMRLGDVIVPARAVAAVGTVPEARCIGCAGMMMQEAARRMRADGAATSPMWPFSFVYYRKFGWEIGAEVRITTWGRDIAFRVPPEGDVAPVTVDDVEALGSVWDAVSPRYRCSTVRVPEHWRRFLRPDRFTAYPNKGGLLCRQGGRPAGYLLYGVPEVKEDEEPRPVEVGEFRALNTAAEVALIKALSEQLPGAGKFEGAFPASDRLRSVAVNPRDFETQLQTSFGFRVIDPAKIFPSMRTERAIEPVRLRVEDELLGSKTWTICFGGGPAEAAETQGAPDLTCAIPAFSQIASGFLKPLEAVRAGLLTGDASAAARLDEATSHWTLPFRSGLEEG